jgi:hypothetical protein
MNKKILTTVQIRVPEDTSNNPLRNSKESGRSEKSQERYDQNDKNREKPKEEMVITSLRELRRRRF